MSDMYEVLAKECVQLYAASMHELATLHWSKRSAKLDDGTAMCRIDWITIRCVEYFLRGGMDEYYRREIEIREKIASNFVKSKDFQANDSTNCDQDDVKDKAMARDRCGAKITLLDVGSCYNPFGKIDIFDVTAVDLVPFSDDVLQCDFLTVGVGSDAAYEDNARKVVRLPEKHFDVVVFCLFLEYLPCPEQRYNCCAKAYELLKDGGILAIVSPDSKHVGANNRIMKSWRFALSKLGFARIRYEKLPHVHGLIFRKCIRREVAARWAELQAVSADDALLRDDRIFIPQDFQTVSEREGEKFEVERFDVDAIAEAFEELPGGF